MRKTTYLVGGILVTVFAMTLFNATDVASQETRPCPAGTRNGNVNADISGPGTDLGDAVYLLNNLFLGGPPPCDNRADLEEALASARANLESTQADLATTEADLATAQIDLESCVAGNCFPPPELLPDTGQTNCYDESGNVVDCASGACVGQDGLYKGCPSEGRFLDNGDGTVTDNCTGLMWQKDTGNDGAVLGWCSALSYCENLEFAGHDDWRLPNVRELHSIVDYGRRVGPSIDPVFDAVSSGFWSSTSVVHTSGDARIVFFDGGGVGLNIKSFGQQYVRAVRSGALTTSRPDCQFDLAKTQADLAAAQAELASMQAELTVALEELDTARAERDECLNGSCPPLRMLPDTGQTNCFELRGQFGEDVVVIPCTSDTCAGQDGRYATGCFPEGRFVDNGDGTVTDNCTGLMWQQDTADSNGDGEADTRSWCDAMAYCENLEFAGHDDWRLPNVRELQSIVDYGRSGPSVDPVFTSVASTHWSSTSHERLPRNAWTVRFLDGEVDVFRKDFGTRQVRGRAYGPLISMESASSTAETLDRLAAINDTGKVKTMRRHLSTRSLLLGALLLATPLVQLAGGRRRLRFHSRRHQRQRHCRHHRPGRDARLPLSRQWRHRLRRRCRRERQRQPRPLRRDRHAHLSLHRRSRDPRARTRGLRGGSHGGFARVRGLSSMPLGPLQRPARVPDPARCRFHGRGGPRR